MRENTEQERFYRRNAEFFRGYEILGWVGGSSSDSYAELVIQFSTIIGDLSMGVMDRESL